MEAWPCGEVNGIVRSERETEHQTGLRWRASSSWKTANVQLATAERARRHGAGQRRDVSQCRDFGGEPGLMAERARKAGPGQMHARTEGAVQQAKTKRRRQGAHRGLRLLDAESCDISGQRTCSRRCTRRDGREEDQARLDVRKGRKTAGRAF